MSLGITEIIGFGAGGALGPPAEISFTDSSVTATDATNYTFSSQALGAAATNRVMILGLSLEADKNVASAITIGGVSATNILQPAAGSGNYAAEIWVAAVPTGTTGDVVITGSGASVGCGIGLWRALYMSQTASDTDSDIAPGSGVLATSIDCPAGGVIVGMQGSDYAGTRKTWVGLTEDFDEAVDPGGNDIGQSGASLAFAAAQTGLVVTVTTPGAGTLVVASFARG